MNPDAALTGTVPALLAARVRATPDAPAFCTESAGGAWQALSWREFAATVGALRDALAAQGLRKGDRLALIAPVSLQWEQLHHAALSMGVVVVGLDAHDLPERLAAMAELAEVAAFAVADAKCLAAMAPQRLNEARFVLSLGPAGTGWLPQARMLDWSGLLASDRTGSPPPEDPQPGDAATVIFTSGTTGAPKGIEYSHGQLCLAIEAICEAYAFIGPHSRLLCWLPLSNLFQRIVNLAGIRNGPCTYLLADPRRVMDVVAGVSPDIFVGVPRFYEKLYEGIQTRIQAMPAWQRELAAWAWGVGRRVSRRRLDRQPLTLPLRLANALADGMVLARIRAVMGSRLRCMVTGSAPMSTLLLQEFGALGWPVLEAYGLSENVLPMAMNRIDAWRWGTVGRPLEGNEIRIDADGTVRVRGPGVFGNYLGASGPPPKDGEGYYATGDLGHLDADGFLHLVGRSGEMIKTSTGRRVMPGEAERRLQQVPGLEQVILLGAGRKYVVALGCTDGTQRSPIGRESMAQDLREQVLQISPGERPQGIAIVEHPFSIEAGELTPNLKLRRDVLQTRHAGLIERLYGLIDSRAAAGETQFVVIWG